MENKNKNKNKKNAFVFDAHLFVLKGELKIFNDDTYINEFFHKEQNNEASHEKVGFGSQYYNQVFILSFSLYMCLKINIQGKNKKIT